MSLQEYIFSKFLSGCQRLSAIEEDIVLAFTESGGDSPTRFYVTLNKAYSVRLE